MNSMAWIRVIVSGVFMTGIGLFAVAPTPDSAGPLPDQAVLLLISLGLLTCLIGATGLCGMLAWIPGLREEQKSYL